MSKVTCKEQAFVRMDTAVQCRKNRYQSVETGEKKGKQENGNLVTADLQTFFPSVNILMVSVVDCLAGMILASLCLLSL